MAPKKVLLLVNGFRLLGAERVAVEIAKQLSSLKVEPIMGLVNGGESLENELAPHFGDQKQGIVKFSGRGGFFGIVFRIVRYCLINNVSVVHSHGYKSNLISLFIKVANFKIMLVATNHNYIVSTLKEKIYSWIDSMVLRLYNKVVAVSEDVKIEMVQMGLSENKILVIDNGIDADHPPDRSKAEQKLTEISWTPENILVGIVASLTPEKAHACLIDAFAIVEKEIPYVKLVVIGDGALRNTLEHHCARLGLAEKVCFMGHRSDARDLVAMLDIFVLPSFREGLPMALLEAMAAKVPAIASTVGAIPNVICDGINGYLVAPGNAEQLAEKMRLLVRDTSLRRRMGIEGRRTVGTKYSGRRMAEKYRAIYLELMGEA